MSLSVNSRFNITPAKTGAKKDASKVAGTDLADLIPPIEDEDTSGGKQQDTFEEEDDDEQLSSVELALDELEEKYLSLVEAINVDSFKAEHINRYIARAENRRGAAFKKAERKAFREASKSTDEEVIRLLALELRIGVPKRVEREALAAMGNLMLNRDQDEPLKKFIQAPGKDANLVAYIRTVLMTNRVEHWMGRYEDLREKVTTFGRKKES